jgi:cAMP-dependent protein kinase regulator
MAQNMSVRYFMRGEVIIRQEDLGDAMYVVEEGEVVITDRKDACDQDEVPREIARVGKNGIFGERSLIYKEPRIATVTAVSESVKCLVITKDTFDALVETNVKLAGATRESIARDVVRRMSVFKDFSPSEKEEVFKVMVPITFHPGAFVFTQGTAGNTFYIVAEGMLEVRKDGEHLGYLQAGDYFGELALISNQKRSASVYVMETSNLMYLSRPDFERFLGKLKDQMLTDQSSKRQAVTKNIKKKPVIRFNSKRR